MLGVDPRGSYITELYPSLTYTQTLETDGGHTASEAHSPLHHEVVVGASLPVREGNGLRALPRCPCHLELLGVGAGLEVYPNWKN